MSFEDDIKNSIEIMLSLTDEQHKKLAEYQEGHIFLSAGWYDKEELIGFIQLMDFQQEVKKGNMQ